MAIDAAAQPPEIVVVGSINRDVTVHAESIPQPGETVMGTSITQARGGKGANQALAAARLGRRVAMIGRVGADGDGTACLRALKGEGIDLELVEIDGDNPTGHATIIVDRGGENAIVVIPGANGRLRPQAVRTGAPVLIDAAVTLVQLEIPMDAVQEAMSLARGTVILNPAPAQRIPAPMFAQIDIIVPNRTELAAISGRSPATDLAEVERQARTIIGPQAVVVTLGGEGALVVDAAGTTHIEAVEVDVVDTTGAGDAFCGALADAVARRQPLAAAVRWAVTAGALATTRRGAQGGLPTQEQLTEAFL